MSMKVILVSAIVLAVVSSCLGYTIRQLPNQAAVAFSTALTTHINNHPLNDKVVFNKVITNIGSGYNSADGVFTAPVAGTYVFQSSILAAINKEIRYGIVVNGVRAVSMWARGSDGRHDQGGNSIIVQLKQGDEVHVQNYLAGGSIYGSDAGYTTFSGHLLDSVYYTA